MRSRAAEPSTLEVYNTPLAAAVFLAAKQMKRAAQKTVLNGFRARP